MIRIRNINSTDFNSILVADVSPCSIATWQALLMKSILNCQQIWITMMLCWISSVVFVRCTPLALSAGKKRKIEKKIFFSFSARTHVLHFFFCIPFPREKREKTIFFLFFSLCPDEKSFFFFLFSDEKSFFFFFSFSARTHACFFCFCIPFPRKKTGKIEKNLFFFLCPNARVFFFVSAYLFPAKKGKNRKTRRRLARERKTRPSSSSEYGSRKK